MDDFDLIVAGVELEVPEGLDYTALSDHALMTAVIKVRQDLMTRGVIMHPETGDDMDKQSIYFGLLSEMRRRGLM